MSGLFSPNFRVLNEPRYLRSTIRTTMRCLSSSLPTAITFAGINVIAALLTLISRQKLQTFTGVCVFRLYEFNCMQLARSESPSFERNSNTFFARTHDLLQYHFRTVA